MLENISYYIIFGKPLIMYLGILTLSSFLITAYIGFMTFKGKTEIPFKWHPRMAAVSLMLAILHSTLGILHYF